MRIGNRVTEKDVRQWLDAQGWAGRSAKIDHLELHAIQPPGWVQVFRFQVEVVPAFKPDAHENDHEPEQPTALQPSTTRTFFGAVRDDERRKGSPTKIWIFDDQEEQTQKLAKLSEGLITLRNGQTTQGFLPLLIIFVGFVLLVATLLYWLKS